MIGTDWVHNEKLLHAVKTCEVTTWMEDAQGNKKAMHSISASLKADGSREHKIDGKIRSSKEVKVNFNARLVSHGMQCNVVLEKNLFQSCSSDCKESEGDMGTCRPS